MPRHDRNSKKITGSDLPRRWWRQQCKGPQGQAGALETGKKRCRRLTSEWPGRRGAKPLALKMGRYGRGAD